MKYWTISYPGEVGQHIQETFSEDQIIESYFDYWKSKMIKSKLQDLISRQKCLDDWIVVHWAVETDELGRRL